ncbi:MAG: S1C family serine protease [Deltaproteobacteria bacterium]
MKEKKLFILLLLAGVTGGALALLGDKFLIGSNDTVLVESSGTIAKNVSKTTMDYPYNLTEAAERGSKIVVHIRAEESETKAEERMNNGRGGRFYFRDFFDFGYGNDFYRMKGGGSGVIYSKDGYIITNKHVVDFADKIIVTLPDKREYKAKKIGIDPSTDLAVIKIDEENLPTVEIANSDESRLGQWVLAIGNPFDYLTSTVTAGIISAKGRDIDIISDDRALEEFIQTDAAVNPGNSGGALIDANGRLLGITTAIATPTGVYAGYSFAIPSNLMKKVVEIIIKKGGDFDDKPTLGVSAATINKELKKEYDLDTETGVYIVEVQSGSSAEAAGIKVGDIITKVNNTEIRVFEDLRKVLNFSKIGETLNIIILRDNKFKTFSVKLKQSL